jgi:acetyltransferase-like isoleucine patch superfamily enzyme
MKSIRLFIVNLIIGLIPVSRFFKLKWLLFRWAGIKLAKNVRLYSNVRIYGTGELHIDEGTFIGHQVILISSAPASITIGKNVDIAPRVFIGTGTHELDPTGIRMAGIGMSKDVVIGDGTWIGANSNILPGVHIGRNSMVAAGSTVTKDVPDFTIVAGNPARPFKRWCIEKKEWLIIGFD